MLPASGKGSDQTRTLDMSRNDQKAGIPAELMKVCPEHGTPLAMTGGKAGCTTQSCIYVYNIRELEQIVARYGNLPKCRTHNLSLVRRRSQKSLTVYYTCPLSGKCDSFKLSDLLSGAAGKENAANTPASIEHQSAQPYTKTPIMHPFPPQKLSEQSNIMTQVPQPTAKAPTPRTTMKILDSPPPSPQHRHAERSTGYSNAVGGGDVALAGLAAMLQSLAITDTTAHCDSAASESVREQCVAHAVAELNTTLMPHQLSALRWMLEREGVGLPSSQQGVGGYLADAMGLGKTLQTIALISAANHANNMQGHPQSGPTLIVCPAVVLGQWEEQFHRHHNSSTTPLIHRYHERRKAKSVDELRGYGVVLTTYDTVQQDVARGEGGLLAAITWGRIVLDEAHLIRSRNTKRFLAVCEVPASCRWMLSGTPVQNSVQDLYSLFRFLRIEPFSDWRVFKQKLISHPRGLSKLRCLLSDVMLRRTRQTVTPQGEPIIALPPRNFDTEWVQLSPAEQDAYKKILTEATATRQRTKDDPSQSAQVLTAILRLRQACTHTALLTKAGSVLCVVCGDSESNVARLSACSHDVCFGCLPTLQPIGHCALCMNTSLNPESSDWSYTTIPPPSQTAASGHKSTKLTTLVSKLQQVPAGEKSVVFSQWTRFLDLASATLTEKGVSHTRVDGSMSSRVKETQLREFRESDCVSVLLVSLKAGNAGLDLTAANHLFMLDVWWNPSVEDQAFDRVYRIGQTKPVTVHRILAEDSIEKRVLALQTQKRQQAADALDGHSARPFRLSQRELWQLLQD